MVGLGLESIIFFFSAFEKTPEEYEWERVYPELGHALNDPANPTPAPQLDNALVVSKPIPE